MDAAAPAETRPAAVSIERHSGRVIVRFAGQVIADTSDALTLVEGGHGPVIYVPRGDCDMSFFARTEKTTHCPRKGDCCYFTVTVDGERAAEAAWSYEAPYPSAIAIRDHLAFYPNRVDVVCAEAAPAAQPTGA